jgi:hypothetical protein
MTSFFSRHQLHFIAVGVFLLVSFLYFLPTFSGKSHKEEDVRQSKLTMVEAEEYYEKEGKPVGWTNRIFSGMPTDLIFIGPQSSLLSYFSYLTPFRSTSLPFQNMIVLFVGFYLFLLCLKLDPLLSLFGALAYGFLTFTFSSVEAAHWNKVVVMGLMPATIGGFYLMSKERFLSGFVVFTYHFALQIHYFHYQITYYSGLMLLVFGLYYVAVFIKKRQIRSAIILVVLSLLGSGMGVAANLQKLKVTQDYAKFTMRGGSALKGDGSSEGKGGLEQGYAFDWSYGIGETFTLLVPGIYGGSSQEPITKRSPIYKTYQQPQVLASKWPLYHGSMPMTSGPVYFGAIIMFFFVLSFFWVKSDIRWPLYIITVLSLVLSWGKNLPGINEFLFHNLPYYNKFRTPMMAMSMAQVSVLTLAILSMKAIFSSPISKKIWKEKVLPSFYAVGGLLLLIMLLGSAFIDTSSFSDSRVLRDDMIPIVKEGRNHLIFSDSLRSLLFISAGIGILWGYMAGSIKKQLSILSLCSLMVIDLVGVDMRYLTWDDFKFNTGIYEKPLADAADNDILKDADPHYRVLDLTVSPFNSNDPAVFHKLIGGYHAAKLSRYQDFIDSFIIQKGRPNEKALDMLNCKYLIVPDKTEKFRQSVLRPTALGNAWFVHHIVTALSDRDEMDSLKEIDPATTAVINIQNHDVPQKFSEDIHLEDSNAYIKLLSYHPDTMRYSYQTDYQRFVVFSEVHYPHWKAFVNGEEMPLFRVNYNLRGMLLPPGEGDIEMIYDYSPADVLATPTRWVSLLVILLIVGWIGWMVFTDYKKQPALS